MLKRDTSGLATSSWLLDSHTCAYGALGAFSTGIGSTDMALCLQLESSGSVCLRPFRFEVEGKLPKCCLPKRCHFASIGDVGVEGARYMTAEFCGSTVRNMDIHGRMTCPTLAIEMGEKQVLWNRPKTTEKYLKERIPGFGA